MELLEKPHLVYKLVIEKCKRCENLIFLVSFFCLHVSCLYGQQSLTVNDCKTGEPIPDIYITSSKQNISLGHTDQNGLVKLTSVRIDEILHFKKVGSVDTIIVLKSDQTTLCVHQKVNHLELVVISGDSIPLSKQFGHFLKKTENVLPMMDDSIYYSFNYFMQVPDKGWECTVSGTIMTPVNSYKKVNSGVFGGKFCEVNIKVNPEFYQSGLFSRLNTLLLVDYYLNYDLLRKKFPYRKKIRDEMMKGKSVQGDSTVFYVEGFGTNRKHTFSSEAVFNKDSILIRDNVVFRHFEKAYHGEESVLLGREESRMEYKFEDLLRINSLNVDGVYSKDETTYRVQFHTHLLMQKYCSCANIHIMTRFDKPTISGHPGIKVELLIND